MKQMGSGAKVLAVTSARLTLTATQGERHWPLMRDLDLTAHAHADADARRHPQHASLPAVIDAPLPAALRGHDANLRLEASTATPRPILLAIPCLRLCTQHPSED